MGDRVILKPARLALNPLASSLGVRQHAGAPSWPTFRHTEPLLRALLASEAL